MVPANVGEIRKLIADLPDDAFIAPDWAEGFSPGKYDPVVRIKGLDLDKDPETGVPYLSVKVDVVALEDLRPDRKMYALVSDQGTAAAETALCEDCFEDDENKDYARKQASTVLKDIPDLETFHDCTGNDVLSCCICGHPNLGDY